MRRPMARWALAVVTLAAALAVVGCRATTSSATPQDAVVADADLVDGPDGTGCTPTTPRTQTPEPFIGPSGLEDRLAALIDSAQHSLDLQMYLFDDSVLKDHIVSAQQRGVAIRVLLDPNESGNQAVLPTFENYGVPVRSDPSIYTYAHAKYAIVDRQLGAIMSMNFNTTAMTEERNYGFTDVDPDDVADLQRIFEMDWSLAGGDTATPPADLDCTRLIVSPVNSRARVLQLINSAQSTLDIEALYVTDTAVVTAVENAAGRGVAVQVILENPFDQAGNDDTAAALAQAGIPVKYAEESQFYLHAKLILADGVALVGSENYSYTSLNENREVAALLFEPDAVASITAQYAADWAATTPAN